MIEQRNPTIVFLLVTFPYLLLLGLMTLLMNVAG